MTEQPSLEHIFELALQIDDEEQRAAYLGETCRGNEALRQEVESLLAAHQAAGSFLESLVTPEPSTPGEQEGDRIGHFKLLELIGEGGFGRVWMAEQTEPVQRRVALKIVKLGMDTGEVLARFEAERQALAIMDHPHIARVFDGGATDTGRPYFVMELVRGVPITDYCDANKLPPRARIELFEKVCRAVQHAHQKGIIHRDLKPSNILVTVQDDQPVPKVIDFGVAKALQTRLTERTLFTRFNQWVGTPAYMSPEQAGMSSLDVDVRSDIYSLGTILYELLTGHTPFDQAKLREEGYDAMLRTIREDDPPKPSTRLSSLPREDLHTVADHRGESPEKLGRTLRGEVDWILLKTLDRDRSRRYDTANALANDLGRYAAGDPISAAPPGLSYRVGKVVRKHWKVATITASFVLLIIAAAVAGTVFGVRANRAEESAIQRLKQERRALATMKLRQAQRLCENGKVDKGLVRFAEGLTIARGAQDKPLAEACSLNLVAWMREAHTLVHMFPHPEPVRCVTVSPDGKLVASACQDGGVRLWNLQTGQPAPPLLEHPAPVNVLAFDPRGTALFTGCADGVVRRWELSDSDDTNVKREFVHAPPETKYATWGGREGVCGMSISKDGMQLATSGYDGWVHVWSLGKPDKPVRSRHLRGFLTWVAFSPRDNDIVAVTEHDRNIVLWNWNEDQIERQIRVAGVPWHFDFDAHSERLVVGLMQSHSARQHDSSTGESIGVPIKHRDALSWTEYSPDGTSILTASADHTARVWNTFTGAPDGSVLAHPATVTCATWSPEGRLIITACDDKIVRVWRNSHSGPVTTMQHPGWVRDVDFGPDSKLLVTGLGGSSQAGGNVRLWDVRTGDRVTPRIAMTEWCSSVVFDPAGDAVYAPSEGRSGTIRRYDLVTGKKLAESSFKSEVHRLAISPNGGCLASASLYEASVRLFDPKTLGPIGKPLRCTNPQIHAYYSYHIKKHHTAAFTFGLDGHSLFTGDFTGYVQLWNTATGRPTGAAKRHPYGISALAVGSDGKMLAVGGVDQRARLLEWDQWRPVGAAMEHTGRITAVTFTPSRHLLLTSSVDGTARAWHVPTGMPVGPVLEHADVVNTVKCSPDGRLAATASDDHTARIWCLPRPETSQVKAVGKCVEALTGVTSTGGDTVRFLSIAEWEKQKVETASLLKRLVVEPGNELAKEDPQRSWIEDLALRSRSESPEATAAIEGTMIDDASRIRAVELLRIQGTPEAARAIARVYASGSDPVRLRAVSALQQMRTPEARRAVSRKIVAFDGFSREEALNWEVLGPDPSHVRLDRDGGTLTIRAQDGDITGDTNNYENVYLIPNPAKGRDFQVTTCVVGFTPTVPWQQAALLCWNDADNHVKLAYEAGAPRQARIVLIPETNGLRVPYGKRPVIPMSAGPDRLWLRLTNIGENYALSTSRNGDEFTPHGYQTWSGGEPEFVGFTALAPGQRESVEIDVTFDFFEVAVFPVLEPAGEEIEAPASMPE